jgi:hypothetical protein
VSIASTGGANYQTIKKGTPVYTAALNEVQWGQALAQAAGYSYILRAVTCVHGEQDESESTANYLQNLVEWQQDYETDIKAITGQSDPVPMFHSQLSSFTRYNHATGVIPQQQLDAHIQNPGKIILVGPKYMFQTADGRHLTNYCYRWMGEYYAKAYRRVILEGQTWEPLRPKSVTLVSNQLHVTFFVPCPPLVLDTSRVSFTANYGFEYSDDSGSPPTITGVRIADSETVILTLSGVPTSHNKYLAYAWTGVSGADAGPTTGARGNLRDSDPTPSEYGNSLYNWAVHFKVRIP